MIFLAGHAVYAQDAFAPNTTKIYRVNFLNPAVEAEFPLSSRAVVSGALGIGYGGGYPDLTYGGSGFIYIISPFMDLQYKYLYNIDRRWQAGKSTKGNSANFISFRFISRGPSIAENVNRTSDFDFAFGPTWGLQRRYGKRFHFLLDMGPQYYFDTEGNGFIWPLMVQINLGIDLN